MSRYQRRGIGWAVAAVLLLLFWWSWSPGSPDESGAAHVQVLEVVRPLAAGDRIADADVALRRVEYSRALAHSLTDPSQAVGRIAAVGLAPGSLLMDGEAGVRRPSKAMIDVAVKVDADAGVPSGQIAGVRGDLVLTQPGRPPHTAVVMSGVTVVSATHTPTAAVVTLRLPARLVIAAIRAESAGDLRLVIHPVDEPS